MNNLDIVFLILIGVSIIYSLIRGLVREIFSFLAVILGFLGASYGYLFFSQWLRRWVSNETLAQILSFVLLFIVIALAVGLLGRLFARMVKRMDLSWADRLGGAAFGFLKAVLLIAIILLVLTSFLPPKSKVVSHSKIAPHALAIARAVSFLVPVKLRTLYAEKERELRKYWALREIGEKREDKGGKRR